MDFVSKAITDITEVKSQCLVVPIFDNSTLTKSGKSLDKATKKQISSIIKRGDISSNIGSSLLIPLPHGIKAQRLLLIGAGDGKLATKDLQTISSELIKQLTNSGVTEAILLTQGLKLAKDNTDGLVRQLTKLFELSTYQYVKTLSKPNKKPAIKKITFDIKPNAKLKQAISQGKAMASGMNVARELGNLPGNVCTPSYLAQQAKAMGRKYKDVSVSILEEKKMRELGMGSLLSVTAGTDQPAKLIVIKYQGAAKSEQPHVLVGKGITFDSGGISLKPGAKMDEMKYDMCGAASVFGTMQAVIDLGLSINVVAIVAAAENLPSGNATKPGDVVTSMSGQTIEILNTDAEGRLVLCDALTYAERFKPKSVIDIATLTGACVVALGSHASAIYSNEDDMAQALLKSGESAYDRGWHMPLWDEYQGQLKSNFADMANIGGPEAGSVTAACFLSRFTKAYRWAHMDIAGTAWVGGAAKGATGRPVSLLTQYLIDQTQK